MLAWARVLEPLRPSSVGLLPPQKDLCVAARPWASPSARPAAGLSLSPAPPAARARLHGLLCVPSLPAPLLSGPSTVLKSMFVSVLSSQFFYKSETVLNSKVHLGTARLLSSACVGSLCPEGSTGWSLQPPEPTLLTTPSWSPPSALPLRGHPALSHHRLQSLPGFGGTSVLGSLHFGDVCSDF